MQRQTWRQGRDKHSCIRNPDPFGIAIRRRQDPRRRGSFFVRPDTIRAS